MANAQTKKATEDLLTFRVSSGLKRIIGQDLITNDFVAVFELVKNSFDAHADWVELVFKPDSITIIDNGKGMSYEDIVNKWLFVAYSAKRTGEEDKDYRDMIEKRGAFAGSKGVGRFSCDRLGNQLVLQTRSWQEGELVNSISVDWNLFEVDSKQSFIEIPIKRAIHSEFQIPDDAKAPPHGTILEITGLREPWPREKILRLKAHLAKLISPFEGLAAFSIDITAPSELEADRKIRKEAEKEKDKDKDEIQRSLVNGPVENFIFTTLASKTTYLKVKIDSQDNEIESELIDRGELIYKIREPNPYTLLTFSTFECNLFYLNQAAKNTFTRRMGVTPVKFGSVFLFRNGFRVFPIGEEGDDAFGIDRRKQQGYSRFLGTRDIVGRLNIQGSEEQFRESTSRDQGLINTPAYTQLYECFWDKCLKRLENYVVGVTWKDPFDKDLDNISRLKGDASKGRIIDLVASIAEGEDVKLLDYSRNLISILGERAAGFERSLESLRSLAEKGDDPKLLGDIDKAEQRFKAIQKSEAEARQIAEAERQARQAAERSAKESEQARFLAEKKSRETLLQLEEEKKRSLFLASISTLDEENILSLHHQIGIYAGYVHTTIADHLDRLKDHGPYSEQEVMDLLTQLSFYNHQILAVSRFATKANFRMDSEELEGDLVQYIKEYVELVCNVFGNLDLKISFNSSASGWKSKFKPIEISMLFDNLLNNAQKAGAKAVTITVSKPQPLLLEIAVSDNGNGLHPSIKEPRRIFEKGFTTTDGSGLGLSHVTSILEDMNGGIEMVESSKDGTDFIIRIKGERRKGEEP